MTTTRVVDAILNATIVAAAAVVLASAAVFVAGRAPDPSIGVAEESIPSLDFGRADYTVALVLSSACVHCTESMPALREMTATIGRLGHAARCVAVGTEPVPILTSYLEAFHIPVDGVYRVRVTRLSNVTPRVVLFDRNGVVLGDWIGRLDATEARNVVATLVRQPALARSVPVEGHR